jgi:uncharacterized protein (TIGR02246 family)
MSRRHVWMAFFAQLISLLAACTQAPQRSSPDTRATDEKAIRDLEAQWMVNAHAKDAGKLVADYYANDARWLDGNVPTRVGKDAILEAFKNDLANPTHSYDSDSVVKVEVSRSGDLAYLEGANTETFTDKKTTKRMIEKGRYLVVFKKQADGSWKAIEEIDNDEALPQPTDK